MNMLGFRATGEQQGKSTVAIQQSLSDVLLQLAVQRTQLGLDRALS
jgi:hypothetical protein